MRLEEFLYQTDEAQSSFAKRAVIPQSAVSRVCNGGDVRGRYWARITFASGGKVTPQDHFPVQKRRAA